MYTKRKFSNLGKDVLDRVARAKDGTCVRDDSEISLRAGVALNITSKIESLLEPNRPYVDLKKEKKLYFSGIGKCPRKLYYEYNPSKASYKMETLKPSDYIKFVYGDILEELLIYLIKNTEGYKVTGEQEVLEMEVPNTGGWKLRGRLDLRVNGEIADIKSAAPYSYKKFSEGTLITDDPFGYVDQVLGYNFASGADEVEHVKFFAINKVTGELAALDLPVDIVTRDMFEAQLKYLVDSIEGDEPPHIPVSLIHEQKVLKSGNVELSRTCGWCAYRKDCYPQLRSFKYSWGTSNLVDIKGTIPRVDEVVYEKKKA